ncbi:MAG: hypothetical protein AAGN66_14215, partial [Acidobacteriota bacterium]
MARRERPRVGSLAGKALWLVAPPVAAAAALQGVPGVATAAFEPEFIEQHEIYARTSLFSGRLDLS